ncbi:enoyl-CoA hydratase-related protein [Rhodococcus sp. USK13]|uniref:enoyl-CoA hydratase/isomerase family protein n=1 Tax=Rhodococcus sp. USK13 TaxID=2806442 RepID=UPI001BCB0C2D|nr:enoyl-CoA hydratase-related protein [Rhodococcus sp. USK13]
MSSSRNLVVVENVGAVRVLELNDPERRNALSGDMRLALLAAFDDIAVDPTCMAVVLTGSGGAFSAGGDLSNMPPSSLTDSRGRLNLMADLIRSIADLRVPVVAAVEGPAAGAGMSIALACDQVVAARSSTFVASFVHVGLGPDAGLSWLLPRRVGVGKAAEILMLGERIDGESAVSTGIADRLADDGAARKAATDLAGRLAGKAPLALAAIKRLLLPLPVSLNEALAAEQAAQVPLLASADFLEGKAAFYERRPATFSGR